MGNLQGTLGRFGHAVGRSWEPGVSEYLAESAAFFGQVDRLWRGANDRHAGVFEGLGQLQRGLPAQLDDHASYWPSRSLGVIDLQHVFQGEWLEVKPIRGVVIGGDGLGVAIDHHRFITGVAQCHRGMDAGVIELDSLPDPVRTRAQNQHRWLGSRLDLGLFVVGRIVVRGASSELSCAGINGLEHRTYAQCPAQSAHHISAQIAKFGDLGVGQAVSFGRAK